MNSNLHNWRHNQEIGDSCFVIDVLIPHTFTLLSKQTLHFTPKRINEKTNKMKYSALLVLIFVALIQIVSGAEASIKKALLISSLKRQMKRYPKMNSERFLSTRKPSFSTKAPSRRGDGTFSTKAPSRRGDGTFSTKAPSLRGGGTISTNAPTTSKGKGSKGSKSPSSKGSKSPSSKGSKSPSSKGSKSPSSKGKKTNSPNAKKDINIGGLQSSAFSMQTMTKITSTVVAMFWFLM